MILTKYVLSPPPSPTQTGWTIGGKGERVRFHPSHGEDQGIQRELEFARPALCRGAGWDQRQSGWVSSVHISKQMPPMKCFCFS